MIIHFFTVFFFLFKEKQNPIYCPCALLQLRYKLLIS